MRKKFLFLFVISFLVLLSLSIFAFFNKGDVISDDLPDWVINMDRVGKVDDKDFVFIYSKGESKMLESAREDAYIEASRETIELYNSIFVNKMKKIISENPKLKNEELDKLLIQTKLKGSINGLIQIKNHIEKKIKVKKTDENGKILESFKYIVVYMQSGIEYNSFKKQVNDYAIKQIDSLKISDKIKDEYKKEVKKLIDKDLFK